MEIRRYVTADEVGWVRCRTLSFLDTAYFDNVLRKKEIYKNPAIELVAVENNQVVGILDIEYEETEKTICTRDYGLGGMIWHIAVHPDFQRKGIATKLLEKAEQLAIERGLHYLEAWTRDDEWVNNWYEQNGFTNTYSYLQVFLEGEQEVNEVVRTKKSGFNIVQAWAHYTGDDEEGVTKKFERVHECRCYEKRLNC